jgi:hypothetical protein
VSLGAEPPEAELVELRGEQLPVHRLHQRLGLVLLSHALAARSPPSYRSSFFSLLTSFVRYSSIWIELEKRSKVTSSQCPQVP